MGILLLLAFDGAVAGLVTLAVLWVLRRFGKRPPFVGVFICVVIGLAFLSGCVATLLPALQQRGELEYRGYPDQ